MTQDDQRPKTGVSIASSSATHFQPEKVASATVYEDNPESTAHQDEKGDRFQDSEDEWAADPENARNWSVVKKWTAVSIVRSVFSTHYSPSNRKL
jgi:hypothetical protein